MRAILVSFLYAHKIHTLWWGDINEPEQWGFASQSTSCCVLLV
jgi:hypothetical protein